jgi:hypothetical protein
MDRELYKETQSFHRIFYAVLLVCFLFSVLTWAFVPQEAYAEKSALYIGPFITLAIFGFVFLLMGRMVVTVGGGELQVSFGYLGWIRKRIPISQIKGGEVVTYRPLRQFGGWGIRCGCFNGERVGCYSTRGDRGVLLTLSEDTRVCLFRVRSLIIGSQEPEKLLEAIRLKGNVE